MLNIVMSNHFKRDLKLARKRGSDISLLDEVVMQLASEIPLAAKYRDHDLKGNYLYHLQLTKDDFLFRQDLLFL